MSLIVWRPVLSDPAADEALFRLSEVVWTVRQVVRPCDTSLEQLAESPLITPEDAFEVVEALQEVMRESPAHPVVDNQYRTWASDAFLAAGDFERAWQVRPKTQDTCLNLLPRIETALTAADILEVMSTRGLTDLGRKHVGLVAQSLQIQLDCYVAEFGTDPISRVLRLAEDDMLLGRPSLARLRALYSTPERFHDMKSLQLSAEQPWGRHPKVGKLKQKNYYGLDMLTYRCNSIMLRGWFSLGYMYSGAADAQCSRLLREAEDLVRMDLGLPRVGEGWLSETELYQLIRDAFPKQEVVHHGRPAWLGRQHFDIWLPKSNVAIEYHGLQHDQPVDHFGGLEAFAATQERDTRKTELCEQHGCVLLEVREGYDWSSLMETIKIAIAGGLQ